MPNSPASTEPRGDTKVVEYDRYVDEQVRKTARAVRAVDISQSVLRLLTVAVAVMLVVAVVEHWGIRGGLGSGGRYAVFLALLLATLWWLVRDLWPLVRRGINPVFAAQTIEQASPSLKNSLVNLLLLRTGQDKLPPAVYQTIEKQAADRLVALPEGDTVDGRGLISWGYLLVAVLALGALYAIISPKNPFSSAARVLMPWAEIAAPTRVRISDVAPGSAESTRGEEVLVAAAVTGLQDEEQPQLVILGGGDRDRRIAMTEAEGLNRFSAPWLPVGQSMDPAPGDASIRYRIEAGDARSPVYRLLLVTAPAIAVRRVEYDYPDYTGYLDRVAEGIGDLRAIEGTKVKVFAEANLPIAEAAVDLQGDGRPDLRMKVDGREAKAELTLGLREDRRTPRFSSYVLRFTSTDERVNATPASYRVDVLPDYPPEAAVLAPEAAVRDVRLNETVAVRVEARDPDFALASVRVRGEALGDEVFEETLLAKRHEGRFEAIWRFTPAEHGLRVGEVVDYWVVATDVRTPEPHRGVSERRKFRIVSPKPGEPDQENAMAERNPGEGEQSEAGEQEEGDEGDEGKPQGGQSNQGEPQGGGEGEGQANQEDGGGEQQQGGAGEQQEQSEDGQGQEQSPEGGIGSNEAGQEGGESNSPNGGSQSSESGGGESQQRGGDSPSGGDSNKNESQSADDQQGGGNQQNGGGESEEKPVSSSGDDDAEAFDRIREHLNEQEEGQSKDGQSGEQSDGQGQASDQTGEGQPKPSADEQPDRESGDSPPDQPRDATNDRKQSDQSTSSEGGEESAGEDSAENSRNPREGTGGAGKNQAADEGNGAAGDQGPGEEGQRGGDQRDAEGQQGNRGDGKRGEGQQQRDGQGDEQGGEAGEQQRNGEGEGDQNQEGSSAKNQSESGGDRPGEEAGRDAADGKGSGDQTSAGDQADASQSGENQRGGDSQRKPASSNQDQSNQERGQPGEEPGERNPGQPGGDESSNSNPEGGEGGGAGEHMGGEPGGDEANLDYAREQTDLVLERLSEQLQEKKVDQDLLERLGWSEEDLRRFVARWQSRKQAAQQRGGESQEQLDDALRSLGLKPRALAGGSDARDDTLRDVTGGRRSTVPAKYRDRLRRYNESISSGDE